jgi:hypothetical protein
MTDKLDNSFVDKLNIELEKIYNSTNFKNNNIDEELCILVSKMDDSVIPLLKEYTARASQYYKEREEYSNRVVDPVNEKVKIIIENIKKEYLKLHNDELTYTVASSYSSKMNLIGESDIDYFILFKPLTTERLINISQLLQKYNLKFYKVMNKDKVDNIYYVYQIIIDDIEVEFKVRDLYYSRSVVALHDYTDNKLDQNLKILFTYAKYQLKLKSKEAKKNNESFKGYDLFKTLFYNYCFKDIDDAFYIIF